MKPAAETCLSGAANVLGVARVWPCRLARRYHGGGAVGWRAWDRAEFFGAE